MVKFLETMPRMSETEPQKPITAILMGAGNRGMMVYGNYALQYQEKLKFVAVAEPIENRRAKFAKSHKIPQSNCHETWEQLLKEGKIADAAFICTSDRIHVEPALKALGLGYDVLLEKPMAHDLKGCLQIVNKVEKTQKRLMVAHVLRYTKFFQTVHETLLKGRLGEVMNITHRENFYKLGKDPYTVLEAL